MNPARPKTKPLRIDSFYYEGLRRQVLRRDNWRCQSCGAMSNLEVHHRQFRSRGGEDTETNLITLCSCCHAQVHKANASRLEVKRRTGELL